MGVRKVIQKGFFSGLNPASWLGMGSLKQQTSVSVKVVKDAFSSQKEGDGYKPESFEDCMQHYDVSDEGLQKKMKTAKNTVYFCLGLSVLTLLYMLYQFSRVSFGGGLLCLILTFILWLTALREHFNLFQMRERRLGCTFKEWAKSLFK